MPVIIPRNDSRRWDQTPRNYIQTRCYRIQEAPPLEKARAVQREAYDWALKTLDQSPQLKVRAKGDSLWARLTLARKDGTLPREPLVLQRAAAAQAHAVFSRLEEHWRQQTDKALREQDKKVSARLVRQLGRGPKPITSYLRGHPSRQHRRQAIAVLEGVSVCEGTGGRTVKVRGVGTISDSVMELLLGSPDDAW